MHNLFDERRYLIPFRSMLLPQIFTDTLVIGSGVAGLAAALAAAEHGSVTVLAKSRLVVSNTNAAQGGIASALGEGDSPAAHERDTLDAGAGLCDEPVVRRVCSEGPAIMRRLMESGFRADRDQSGSLLLGREGGHHARRIVHSDGDATGRELARTLIGLCRACPGVRVFENCFAIDLLTPTSADRSPCVGAITFHPKYGLQIIWARATILASGGVGVVWRETTNPPVATGDGLSMGYRAGATLADLAFMQFHPTTLYIAGASRSLITEAVRGEGALLLDSSLARFMPGEHELAELAPRDVVCRAIHKVLARQAAPHVWLDARPIEDFARRFPGIAATLDQFDLDPARDLIPVNPAAHYMIGGVQADEQGRTDIPGFYAAGEASCSGLHGANRLASNSLIEGLVFGQEAGTAAAEMSAGARSNAWGVRPPAAPLSIISDIPLSQQGELDLTDVRSSLRSAMWRNVGIERSGRKLEGATEMFDFWARYTLDKIFDDPQGWETQNMLLLGALIARSALWRKESRGCHWRDDFPGADTELAVHDLWRKGAAEPHTRPAARAEVRTATRVGVEARRP